MQLVGATSSGARVPDNIRFASFYRALPAADRLSVAREVAKGGVTPADAARRLGVMPSDAANNYRYGHIKQKLMGSNLVNIGEGRWEREVPEGLSGADLTKWLQANPKVKGFSNDLLGDDTNIAADIHFMRMLAMSDGGGDFLSDKAQLRSEAMDVVAEMLGPRVVKKYTTTRTVNGKKLSTINLRKAWEDGRIKDTSQFQDFPTAWADTPRPTEYAKYEEMANIIAAEYGMTPAQFQASLWMGAGDMTGLADGSQGTFMQLFRRSLDNRANDLGISRSEMLKRFIHDKTPLAIVPAGVGILGAVGGQPATDEIEAWIAGTK